MQAETAEDFKLSDGTLVPKGSKLVGHVEEAMARSRGDTESRLVVAFDTISIKSRNLPVRGALQALFPPPDQPDPGFPSSTVYKGGAATPGGGIGALPTPGYQPTDVKTGSNLERKATPASASDVKATGVHGVRELSLENGVLNSSGKRVKLSSGTRLIVRVEVYH